MSDEITLSACRYCGHDGEGLQHCYGDVGALRFGSNRYQVACLQCGTHGPQADDMAEAVRLWNMPTADHQELIAAQRAARMLRAG